MSQARTCKILNKQTICNVCLTCKLIFEVTLGSWLLGFSKEKGAARVSVQLKTKPMENWIHVCPVLFGCKINTYV